MEAGSVENRRSNFQPTTTDGGSAENAGAIFSPSFHGHIRTAIPGSLHYTTTTDGGSAENAWSNFQPVLPWTYSHRHPWLLAIYLPSLDIKEARYVSGLKYYRIKVMD